MPRQRRSAPAPRQQTRSAHTATAPTHQAPPQHSYPAAHPPQPVQAQSSQPGLFGQMASTAAGVAVGSTIGHTLGAGITSMFGGSSSSAPAEAAPQQQQVAAYQQQQTQEQAKHCDADARNFTRCLEDNSGNMQICDYYLQQLKACQEASRQY
ncbi:MIX17 Mitochondrial intermembrane space cysteine motif-containing protein MIX17 [Candida maltosa Xu316]|uniref:CHCH domain-containing protein n=1 Tax=Candida maltosa (strain Xu316) TaxID=1245528 RepID=M3JTS2_CANMX|nr:hypothetical protein G210_4041 [Candida maltosa Xu316]